MGFIYTFWSSLLSTSSILEYGFYSIQHLQMTSSEGFEQHFSIISKFVCYGFYVKKNVVFTLISFAVLKWAHLAWAEFRIKVKRIAHSIVHFDQWNKLISKMESLKIFTGLFSRTPRLPRSNDLGIQNDENSIMKSYKN